MLSAAPILKIEKEIIKNLPKQQTVIANYFFFFLQRCKIIFFSLYELEIIGRGERERQQWRLFFIRLKHHPLQRLFRVPGIRGIAILMGHLFANAISVRTFKTHS